MAASGVQVDDECTTRWGELKKGSLKACVFRLTDDKKSIIVDDGSAIPAERGAGKPEDFEKFQSFLPAGICRYAVYNFVLKLSSGDGMDQTRDKMVFITWAPDDAKIKDKMLTAASKDALKKKLDGVALEFQCSCESDIQASNFIEKLQDVPNIKLAGQVVEFEGRPVGDW